MSDKKREKKIKSKSGNKAGNFVDKDFMTEIEAAVKTRMREEKEMKLADKKARDMEKKMKKALKKEAKMASSVSGKRIKKQKKLHYERQMNREEAVHYFISLISGLKNGNLHFSQGKNAVVITPAELVDVEIKAESKGKMEKITFEMAWFANSSGDMSITSS